LFLIFKIIVRSTIAATILLVFAEIGMMSENFIAPWTLVWAAAIAIIGVAFFRRFGLLAFLSLMLFNNLGILPPTTLDTSVWYFGRSLFTMAVAIAIAGYAFRVSLATQPLFGAALLEEE